MKKFLTGMVAAATLFSAGAAFAANQVQVTLTSPTIVKTGCEKAGSIQFAFDAGSAIVPGDWWYLDLPLNTTLCKSYDYMIGASTATTGISYDTTITTGYSLTVAAGAGLPATIVETATTGPITGSITGNPGVAGGNAATQFIDANNNNAVDGAEVAAADLMTFRVVGTAGSRRITIYALGAAGAANANEKILVNAGYKMNIKIMDGKAYNTNTATTNKILLNKDVEAVTTTLVFGEQNYSGTLDEVIGGNDGTPATEPAVENTLCLDASNPAFTSDLLFLSFASRSDKFTFTGDSQIAHTGASMSVSLVNCKGATSGQILIGGQNSCSFNYQTAAGYCPTFGGNRVAIQTNAASFGDLGDSYALTAESMTDGVYFASNALTLKGYTQAQSASGAWCSATGAAITPTGGVVGYVGSTVATSYPDSSCSIPAAKKVAKLVMGSGSFLLNDINTLETTLPVFVYDKTVIAAGIESKVRLTLDKAPCGTIFQGTQTVGTFVTTCTAAAGTTSLMFPFFPPMDPQAAPGWWGGYVIVNGGSSSGTAVLTYTDAAGATATYTTAAIAAGAQFNGSGITSTDLTAGTGTFNKTTNYSIKAACNFSMAAGFAFVSSPEAAASYVAYTSSGWQ